MRNSLLTLAILLCSVIDSTATKPKAPHLVYHVAAGSQVELELRGYDRDGDMLTTVISRLPEAGHLYDLSQIYSTHKREPKTDAKGEIKANGHVVPKRSRQRVIYKAPRQYRVGKYATLRYTVSDGLDTSAEGYVTIIADVVSPNKHVLVSSDFTSGNDGWKIVGNGAVTDAIHERSSHGLLNYFVYGTDTRLNIDKHSGFDKSNWYFSAPSKFLGFHAHAYDGTLDFTLGGFSGDFAPRKRNLDINFVILECKTCNTGRGMLFAIKLKSITFDGGPQKYSFKLNEKAWLKDPKNTLSPWTTPTQCEFIEMMGALSGIRVLGDFTNFYETVALDQFQFVVPRVGHKNSIPMDCLCANPGLQCRS